MSEWQKRLAYAKAGVTAHPFRNPLKKGGFITEPSLMLDLTQVSILIVFKIKEK